MMAITRVEVHPLKESTGNVRALATVIYDNAVAVGPFRVVEGQKGLFVGHPQRKDQEGQWHDIVRPLTAESRKELHEHILSEYYRHINRSREQVSPRESERGR